MSVTQAVIAELSRPRRSGGHSYAAWLLARWVWSRIGWWTMVPAMALSALGVWAKLPARPRPRSRPAYRGIPPEEGK